MLPAARLVVDNSDKFIDDLDYVLPEGNRAVRILLIEDNKSDVLLVKKMLEDISKKDSYEFTNVPRMGDAIELLGRSAEYDLILLDLNLLDIDGTASVAALNAEAPNIPIVVYSATDDPKQKEEALLCGARHYLVKGKESSFSLKYVIQETTTYVQS